MALRQATCILVGSWLQGHGFTDVIWARAYFKVFCLLGADKDMSVYTVAASNMHKRSYELPSILRIAVPFSGWTFLSLWYIMIVPSLLKPVV